MSDKVITLVEADKESGEGVIEALEEALHRARNGEILNCMIVTVNNNDTCSRSWANHYRQISLIGQLECAKLSLIQASGIE